MKRCLLLVVTLLTSMLGCGSVGLLAPTCPPDWYAAARPSDATWAVGVGHCGKTYLPQDGQDLALARAVNELAAQAGVAIQSESLLVQRLRGQSYVEEWSQQINARIEGIIRGFEIVEQHHCYDNGQHNLGAGSTLVLVRILRSELALDAS